MDERVERVRTLGMGAYRRGRRVAGRVKRRLLNDGGAAPSLSVAAPVSAAVVVPSAPDERPRPLPEGWSEDDLRTVMHTFSIDGSAPGELDHYLNDALWRFLHTWGLVRNDRGTALELGANPYFITWLVDEFTDLELSLANFFGADRGALHQQFAYTDRDGQQRSSALESQLFNLEEDAFPYADNSFDVVLFCEIIEHLLVDPLHALREIHRVLRPDGRLVLTTPNVARLGNVLAMIGGENIYDPYSGYGAYGRHNREFTQHELVRLLTFAGFAVDEAFTANAHPEDYASRFKFNDTMPLVDFRRNDLGQYLFVAARKVDTARDGLPSWLYRSWPADQIVEQ